MHPMWGDGNKQACIEQAANLKAKEGKASAEGIELPPPHIGHATKGVLVI